jgi:hypothetical protein
MSHGIIEDNLPVKTLTGHSRAILSVSTFTDVKNDKVYIIYRVIIKNRKKIIFYYFYVLGVLFIKNDSFNVMVIIY